MPIKSTKQKKILLLIFTVLCCSFALSADEGRDRIEGRNSDSALEGVLQTGEELEDNSPVLTKDEKGFYTVQVEDITLSTFVSNISNDLKAKILVDHNIKSLTITGTYHFRDVEELLNQLSKELRVSYAKEDDVYVLGDKKVTIKVLSHQGITERIKTLSNSNIFLIDDKLVLSGTESEVRELQKAIEQIQKKELISLKINAFYLDSRSFRSFGTEWEKLLSLSHSGTGLQTVLKASLSDFVHSFKATYVDEKSNTYFRSVLDTSMTVISGKQSNFFVGEKIQKEVFTATEGSNGSELVSGFETEEAGLTIGMTFYQSKDYVVGKMDIEDTRFISDTKETGINYNSHVIIDDKPVKIVSLNRQTKTISESSSLGVISTVFEWIATPFKYVFGVEDEENTELVFVLLVQQIDPADMKKPKPWKWGDPIKRYPELEGKRLWE